MSFTVGVLDATDEPDEPDEPVDLLFEQAAAPRATAPIATTVTARLNMLVLPFQMGWTAATDRGELSCRLPPNG
jgi:hypothetical protein